MSFFQQLSDTTKRQVLEASRGQLATELVSMLLRYGIDPEDFDISNPSSVEESLIGPDIARVGQVCQGLTVIEAKLAALGS